MKLTDAKTDQLLGSGDHFHFFMPISKAESKDGRRWIQGVASTRHRDLQGEVVIPGGIDYSYFLRHGYINDDHKDGPHCKVGEATECKLTPAGLWIKGWLYKGKERSDHWWEHINVLAAQGSKRKVGFSIQGKILRRDGKTILKCWLQDVAITASPVNTNTWAEVVKSLNNQEWDDEEKALSTASMGGALIPESLEGSAKVQTHKSLDRITYDEAVQLIMRKYNRSYPVAKALADAIFVTHGIH